MNINKTPVLKEKLTSYKSITDVSKSLYHATTKSNALKILKEGFKREYCGLIHGEMECRPEEKTIYFSKHQESSNLHTNLFGSEEVVIIEIDSSYLKLDHLYPDDSFYVGIVQEELLADVEDVMKEFDIPIEEAEYLIEQTFELSSENAIDYKPFSLWYLDKEGEVSIAHDIPKEAVIGIVKHPQSPTPKKMQSLEF
ncbi:hypothetical protein ACXHQ0_19450 [Vibrio antiquarius]|uniref:Uncharacterized protein n=1 Tax=Vibrio parahaemolyticus TaxID=670 RepID=A0AA46Z9P2_VIBPH|nr:MULTISPECIES: hypothetical protein [Vibrio harveyi group]KOE73901.1 hypothetical protein ACS91_29800 [Vibrio parahaemolyticus]MCS0314035.1 hypothetical protein [Vibrio diabolicus]UYV30414.1 hypothetical protein M5598_25740 [Vibrio parahaemolyticus]UYW19576.1 hypothetical protein IF561_24915 [Vibrio parahaemolyticus]